MSNNLTIVVVVLIQAVVMIVAMLRFKEEIIIIFEKLGLKIYGKNSETEKQSGDSPKKPRHKVQRPWSFRAALLIGPAILLVFAVSVWWWAEQPAPWRMLLSYQCNQLFTLLTHGFQEPLHTTSGPATLDGITRTLEMRADKLNDRYRGDEIWIVDHFWQYWTTQNLQEYLTINKMFVAKGGKIHRLFFLTKDELQNPEVQTMLHTQCQIGRLGGDQTGNGFELWRADPEIMRNREEYQIISRQFRQLPDTDDGFENFDVVQFKDILYYSSDFSTDHRVLGSSTWIFDPAQVGKVDLRPLFKKHIAERISCDASSEKAGQQQVSVAAPPQFSNPI